ncbi:MAG: LysM peptidoglycan-binding domain-containing protein, partial [Rhodoferax sp.]|nr:LysM peptidoglycan-binding domain-containing protein [Rhodoferax sp.]
MAQTLFDTVSRKLTWTAIACSLLAGPVLSQNFPVTEQQRATAKQVAQNGVPLSELGPDAPQSYTVKPGDTLWDISGMFLKNPWHWPELWGMNLSDIKNPHLIYPGQMLDLDTSNGRARLSLRTGGADASADLPTVRVSPRTRIENLKASALPTLKSHL